jgi:hypothetical protein
MSAQDLIDRLAKVKATGPGRWIACCPAHKDENPSLSIEELEDGRTLIHCFAGCGAIEVLDAVSLDWAPLFPPSVDRQEFKPSRRSIPAGALLQIAEMEILAVYLLATDLRASKTISDADFERLGQAAARLGALRSHVR